MKIRAFTAALSLSLLPAFAAAQTSNPVADAFRGYESSSAKNLIAAAEEVPADKLGFKPTPAQMSFADIVVHLSGGNDFLCGTISGTKAPTRAKVTAAAPRDSLVARLKETFAFCEQALKALDDSKLSEQLTFFGGRKMTRANMIGLTFADWADHYSQFAIYLRLNGMLPPTARRPE